MSEQVPSHESAVAVAAHTDAFAICDAHLHSLIDRRGGGVDRLLYERVVHGLRIPYDRHRSVVENGIALQREEEMRVRADRRKATRRA